MAEKSNNIISAVEARVGLVEKSQEKVEDKLSGLEIRVGKLETYWSVTLALAAILGVGGGWVGLRLSDLQAQSGALLETVDKKKVQAVSLIDEAKSRTIAEVGAAVKTQADKYVVDSFSSHFKSGLALVGGLDGNDGHWLDATIKFVDKNGGPFVFMKVPRVLVSPDNGQTDAAHYYAWAVTVLKVSTTDFTVRVRSVDEAHEHNPGWYRSVGVQWVAFSED
jgi:hypothetical protein